MDRPGGLSYQAGYAPGLGGAASWIVRGVSIRYFVELAQALLRELVLQGHDQVPGQVCSFQAGICCYERPH